MMVKQQQQLGYRTLLGRQPSQTMHAFSLLLLMHFVEIVCFDSPLADSYSDKIRTDSGKEDSTLTTDTNGDFRTPEVPLEIIRDERFKQTNIVEKIGGTTLSRMIPEEQNGQELNCTIPQSPASETDAVSDMNNDRIQFATEPWYSEALTTQPVANEVHSEVGLVNVTETSSPYRVDFRECSTKKRMDFNGEKGIIILDITQPKILVDRQCSLKFTVPTGNIVSVSIRHLSGSVSNNSLYVYRHDKMDCFRFGTYRCPVFSNVLDQKWFYSARKYLQYTFTHTGYEAVQVSLHFKSHENRPEMAVKPVSYSSGTITSPMYDGVSVMPTGNVGHSASVIVQPGFVVMISVQHFDLVDADNIDFCLQIKKFEYNKKQKQNGSTSVADRICVADGTNIQLFNTSFTVQFLPALTAYRTRGFKLFYSFHTAEEKPVRFHNGLFNCSTRFYKTFKQHLECNFITECQNGEDELDCPYTTASCKQGIHFRDKCYSYFNFLAKVTWMQASSLCRLKDTRLGTFQNSSELDAFARMLTSKHFASVLWIGLQVSESRFGTMYKRILRWTNSISSFDFLTNSTVSTFPSCALMQTSASGVRIKLNMKFCNTPVTSHILCEHSTYPSSHTVETVLSPIVQIWSQNWSQVDAPIMQCSDKHLELDFLSCNSLCDRSFEVNSPVCVTPSGGIMPMFQCDNAEQTLPFALICDHHSDCLDNSDESFCHHRECREFACNNGKCIAQQLRCNKLDDCDDGSDEIECYESIISGHDLLLKGPPFSVIELDGSGSFSYKPWNDSQRCPETHFKCPESHCLPVYLHCNGVKDCSWGEDEKYCKDYDIRPGFYLCYKSKIYLHLRHLCDGVAQCPHHDDEKYCGLKCPSQCQCQGLAFACNQPITPEHYPHLRYLDVSGTNMTLQDLHSVHYLVSLKLSGCGLRNLDPVYLQNLRELNLSNNLLNVLDLDFFTRLPNLRLLDLSWNRIGEILTFTTDSPHLSMREIHLSGLLVDNFTSSQISAGFPNIEIVNISHSKIATIDSLKHLSRLKVLDLSESPVTAFPEDVFRGLENLKQVYAMNYKLCCPAVLPTSFPHSNCFAPLDDLSSCDNLLRLPAFRTFLWIFAVIAIVGNSVSFVVRQFFQKTAAKTGFPVFVTNLCVADLLMGVYLAIIGVADYFYQGSYLWHDKQWKQSWACRIAGFLSLLSSEVSAFVICLITVDRFIVMRFPFTQRRFQRRSAQMATVIAWFIGLIIAALPLTPVAANWEFYGQTGICIPLPFTTYTLPGEKYSFAIMIVLNFVLFVMIAGGQAAIFFSVRSKRKAVSYLKAKSHDLRVAQRLASIVLSDFLCWFPIGLLGLLASQNIPVPDEVNVGMAIFVLPLNSALNPFLYTFNALMERRWEEEKRKLIEFLEKRIRSEVLAEKPKHHPQSCGLQAVALMSQLMDKVHKSQLSNSEVDLVHNMIRELLSEIKPRLH